MNSRFPLAVLLTLATTLVGHGQVLSYLISIPSSSTSWNRSVLLPAFDPSLGTLTGVQLLLTGNTVQTVRAENLDPMHTANYLLETAVTFAVSRMCAPVLVTANAMPVHADGTLAGYDGSLNYAGPSGFSLTQARSVSANASDPHLASYLGTSPINFLVSANLTRTSWMISGSSSNVLGSPSAADAVFEIRYAYASPIPEPATSAGLLALLAFGVVAGRRFRSSQSAASALHHI